MRDKKHEGYLERLPDFITDDWDKYLSELDRREQRYKDFCKESIEAMERRDAGEDSDWWITYRNLDPSYLDWKNGVHYECKELTEEEKIEHQKKWEEEERIIMIPYKLHREKFKILEISKDHYDRLNEETRKKIDTLEVEVQKQLK